MPNPYESPFESTADSALNLETRYVPRTLSVLIGLALFAVTITVLIIRNPLPPERLIFEGRALGTDSTMLFWQEVGNGLRVAIFGGVAIGFVVNFIGKSRYNVTGAGFLAYSITVGLAPLVVSLFNRYTFFW